jgi:hypothetical protein
VDAGAMNVAKKRIAIRRTNRVPAFNRQLADAHDGYWADRGVAVANINHAEIRIRLFDDRVARARAVDGHVCSDEEMAHGESVGVCVGRHRDRVRATAGRTGIDRGIAVCCLDCFPQRAIAVGVQFIIGRRDGNTRCMNCAGLGQHQREHQSQDPQYFERGFHRLTSFSVSS